MYTGTSFITQRAPVGANKEDINGKDDNKLLWEVDGWMSKESGRDGLARQRVNKDPTLMDLSGKTLTVGPKTVFEMFERKNQF